MNVFFTSIPNILAVGASKNWNSHKTEVAALIISFFFFFCPQESTLFVFLVLRTLLKWLKPKGFFLPLCKLTPYLFCASVDIFIQFKWIK